MNEKFTALETEVAKLIDILLSTDEIVEHSTASSDGISRFRDYVKQLDNITTAATANGFTELSNACSTLQQHLQNLIGQNQPLDDENAALLEEWPTLLMAYLSAPEEPESQQLLQDFLQDPRWQDRSLSEHDGSELAISSTDDQTLADDEELFSDLIMPNDDLTQLEDETVDTKIPDDDLTQLEDELVDTKPEEIADFASVVRESLEQTSLTSNEPQEDQITTEEPYFDIETENDASEGVTLPDRVAQLIDILAPLADDPDNTAYQTVLSSYDTQLLTIGAAAAQKQSSVITELCMAMQEHVAELADANQTPTIAQQALLESWPALLLGYIENPTDTALANELLQLLSDSIWPHTLDESYFHSLRDSLQITDTLATDSENEAAAAVTIDSENEIDEAAPLASSATPEDISNELNQELIIQTHVDAEIKVQQEFVELLCLEISEITESFADRLINVSDPDTPADNRQQVLNDYCDELERLTEVVTSLELTGLAHTCSLIQTNQQTLMEQNRVLNYQEQTLLLQWPTLILNYLQGFSTDDDTACIVLIEHLQDATWPTPLAASDSVHLLTLLKAPVITTEAINDGVERQRHAHPEDITLALPDDVNQELVDSLLQEMPSQTADFSEAIQRLATQNGSLQDVEHAQRIAHTLKGAANTVGVVGIANLTHHTEDILEALTKHQSLPNQPLANSLLNVADCLETMTESLVGLSPAPDNAQQVLQEVLDWANRIDQQGIPSDDEAPAPRATTATRTDTLTTTAADAHTNADASEQQAAPVTQAADKTDAQVPMLRVPAPLIDDMLRLVGESIILTGQIQERVKTQMLQQQAVREQNQQLLQIASELEQLVDVQGITSTSVAAGGGGNNNWDSDFDPLEMDQYNELHMVSRRLVELANDASALNENSSDNFATLDNLLIDQSRLHRESQESVLKTRMVPVKTIVPRLQRSVRQTCRLTDKDVHLEISGDETLIDTNVLSDMVDPLMHILRNAIDHGIEDAATREIMGKAGQGRIDLSFSREGNNVVVRCRDDGAGLDYGAIRHTAQERGLIGRDQILDEQELQRLILQPGFSTRDSATQVSGRGVGMDAVYSQILSIKGGLNIDSQTGHGCLFEMRLPITLISTHALLLRTNGQLYAVADRGIEQIVHSSSGQLKNLANAETFYMNDNFYSVSYLDQLLNLPVDQRQQLRQEYSILLVRDEAGTLQAIMVEEVLDSRDLVVKSVGEYVPKLSGILGATILGDGSVTPVLDIQELLRDQASATLPTSTSTKTESNAQKSSANKRRLVMIVDDSLSVRRSMEQLVGDAGLDVRTARDGLEAVELLNSVKPDVLMVDLEMPRMNGLELTSHIRAQTDIQKTPVIMITSRSTEKHRREAKTAGVDLYLTKPVNDDELLSQINAAMTSDK